MQQLYEQQQLPREQQQRSEAKLLAKFEARGKQGQEQGVLGGPEYEDMYVAKVPPMLAKFEDGDKQETGGGEEQEQCQAEEHGRLQGRAGKGQGAGQQRQIAEYALLPLLARGAEYFGKGKQEGGGREKCKEKHYVG